jgi:hypothetical protein
MILTAAEVREVFRQADDQRAGRRGFANQLARALEVRVDIFARGHLHSCDDQVVHARTSLAWRDASSEIARESGRLGRGATGVASCALRIAML